MSAVPPVKVPIGLQAQHWNTLTPDRCVLVVAHHVTSLLRLLDVITVFDSDPRVQVVFSWNGSDPFHHGLHRLLDELGVVVIPWSQAIDTEFHLVIAANHGGLTEFSAPVVILPHGAGYNKNSPGNRKPETGNRKPETGNRKPETGNRSVFGLAPEWLLYDGRPIADSLVLSHDEQLTRLAAITPSAAETAVVAGDPCYDRMVRSAHARSRYREALGVLPGQKLVTVCTTWWRRSLLGTWPSLFRELLACLPRDEYRVAALIHPNIWHGHGPWQVHTWLADCVRAGLIIIPPVEGWQSLLVSADLVVGDHGATTCYAAGLGAPVLLATFPDEDVATGSAAEVLGRTALRLNRHASLAHQVSAAITAPASGDAVRAMLTSCPGESATRLRELFYRHLRLPEPPTPPPVPMIPVHRATTPSTMDIRADHVVCRLGATDDEPTTVHRYPAEVLLDRANADHLDAAHLVAHEDHASPALLDEAAVIIVADTPTTSAAEVALADALRRHRGAALAVSRQGERCLALSREGARAVLRCEDIGLGAAVLYERMTLGHNDEAFTVTIKAGPRTLNLVVESLSGEAIA
ncbi:hypothetical protein GCM10022247_39370 [Allokutzneria multivorans]|uniref:Uncharacterized protein n=1 Tax=Allokutzneria multivorans TaxID=1142134 RepID=A0ABP7SK27_9PSEU